MKTRKAVKDGWRSVADLIAKEGYRDLQSLSGALSRECCQ